MTDSTTTLSPPENAIGINSPQVNESLSVTQHSIKDEFQAWSIFTAIFQANKDRTDSNAEVSRLYTGKQPHNPQSLKDSSQSWRSNFPTLFLAGIVDKVTPTLVSAIDAAKYLTQSNIKQKDNEDPKDRSKKTEIFREKVTKTIRDWKGWRNLVYSLCQEDVLIGYVSVIWTDEFTWKPKLAKSDEIAFPEGTSQFAEEVQLFCYKQSMLIHDFFKIIKDRQSAEDFGWEIDNCVKTINNALPRDPQRDVEGGNERQYADLVREVNQGASYMTGAKVVDLAHIFAVETETSKVTHFILDRNQNNRILLKHENRFGSMEDILCMFTLEPGNGKYYGSKGVGRMLANFSIGVDIATNDAVDQVRMGGLLIGHSDSKSGIANQVRVKKPFVITSDITIDKEKFPTDMEPFVALYTQLSKMAEVAAGSYIPNLLSSEQGDTSKKTAREVTIDYTRELQSKAAFVSRFSGQFGSLISNIQQRLCNPDTDDEDAKQLQKDLKESGLSKEEIKEYAESPAAEVVQDLANLEAQQKVAVYDKFAGNPNIDQIKTLQAAISAMTDPEFAKEIILPQGIDPTIEAEQVRQQIIENAAIMAGESIPVSPRDVHAIHLKILMGELQRVAPSLAQNPDAISHQPELLDHINTALVHGEAHLNIWKQQGAQPQELAPFEQFLKTADQALTQFAQMLQKQHQTAAQELQKQTEIAQQPPPEQLPVGTPDQPLPITEKVLIAWIGQYDKLPDDEKRKLETVGGLGPSQLGAAGNSTMTQPEIKRVDQITDVVPAPGATVPRVATPSPPPPPAPPIPENPNPQSPNGLEPIPQP